MSETTDNTAGATEDEQELTGTEPGKEAGTDHSGKYRPAVAGSGANSSISTTGSSSAGVPSIAKELIASRQSAQVKKLLDQIAELESLKHRTSVQTKMLSTLRKALKNQDRADREQEKLSEMRQEIRDAERAGVRSEAIAFVDQVAGAQDIGISEALDKIRAACSGLLR